MGRVLHLSKLRLNSLLTAPEGALRVQGPWRVMSL
jgi:hypothetical protein